MWGDNVSDRLYKHLYTTSHYQQQQKRHNPYISINLEVSPLGLLLFILVSHQNTLALIQEFWVGFFFSPNDDIKIWKVHANPNGLLYSKVKMEITAIFLCEYTVKKLASNYIGRQYLFSKEFGIEHIVIQINKQASKEKPLHMI